MKGSILGIVRIWREVRSGNRSITITRALMYSILSQIKEFKKIFKWISGFLVYIRIYIRSSSSPFFWTNFPFWMFYWNLYTFRSIPFLLLLIAIYYYYSPYYCPSFRLFLSISFLSLLFYNVRGL